MHSRYVSCPLSKAEITEKKTGIWIRKKHSRQKGERLLRGSKSLFTLPSQKVLFALDFRKQHVPFMFGSWPWLSCIQFSRLALEYLVLNLQTSPRTQSRYGVKINCPRKQTAGHSGGSTWLGTLLSFSEDLVQAWGYVVGPGGGAVVPLQVITWEHGPGREETEQRQEERRRKGRREEKKMQKLSGD